MLDIVKNMWEKKVVRFGVVGFGNFLLDILLLNLFVTILELPTIVGNSLSVAIVITISYFVNHRVVFRHPEKPGIKNYLRFFAVTGFSAIVIQDFIIQVVAPRIVHISDGQVITVVGNHLSAQTIEVNAAKIVAVAVGMVWNFLLYRFVVFKPSGKLQDDEVLAV